ncbi:MAG TPA: hypothetical protein VMT20_28975 [Terriglobia bacterium]|nr:hypothetical protein [Terriglobia bacterium]
MPEATHHGGSLPEPHGPSARRIAANRRNALRSTGPQTLAGKRRVALNARKNGLCPVELQQQLRARGEDPSEFRRLHRDLIGIFRPSHEAAEAAVLALATAWWEKARRARNWVAAGPPRCQDLDERLENLLLKLIGMMRQRHEWWVHRLGSVVGWPIGSPAEVLQQIEERLFVFGGQPGRRKYRIRPRPGRPPEDGEQSHHS